MPRVLLIDDDQFSNFLNKSLLQHSWENIEVLVANSGQEGLAFVEEPDRPDLIFLDIRMPLMSGIEFLEHFSKLEKEVISEIKIIMLSSSLDKEEISKSQEFPNVISFLNKPLDKEKILEVRSIIE
jgi:CheY-like chemotaxis protein